MARRSLLLPIQRSLDFLIAGALLFFLSPFLFLVALLVRSRLGAPVFFRQQRPGYLGRQFLLCKFRTMKETRDAHGELLSDAERLTPLGTWMRRFSIDELPQLWNVLKGEMSLVGPRPLLASYLSRYTPEQMRRHEVMPGITGWAQVNGRNAITWEEKFSFDLWYVENASLSLYFRILFLTFSKTIRRDGISATGHVTMPEFVGKLPSN